MPRQGRGPGGTVTESLRRRLGNAVVALRLLVHRTVGVRVLSDGQERLSRARRAWAFQRLRDGLTTRNPFEMAVLSSMTNDDEYGVVELTFRPDDVILDVGAHIGGFSLLCHSCGSRAIFAFEPDPETFALLAGNLARLRGVNVDPRAVFRSDIAEQSMRLSAIQTENTGAPTLLFDGLPFEVEAVPARAATGHEIPTVSLDAVLERFERVRLLKLDCEGGEFPILLTSRELRRVEEIVGEYHEVDAAEMSRLAPLARVAGLHSYRRELLAERLSSLGFEVALTPTSDTLGLFRAVRREAPASARE